MPILELFGIVFEWHDPKYELVLSKRNITDDKYRIITAYFPSNEQIRGYNNARKRF